MPLWLRSFVILLPLAGLGYIWQRTYRQSSAGVEWEVPVSGYDPRDLLRGHYVMFRYDWPTSGTAETPNDDLRATSLCLMGRAPHVDQAVRMYGDNPSGHDPLTCQGVAKEMKQQQNSSIPGQGRLYVPQDQASDYQARLADPRMQAILHFRLRPDGAIVPLTLSFTPKK